MVEIGLVIAGIMLILVLGGLAFCAICAAMLSSQISREEERRARDGN